GAAAPRRDPRGARGARHGPLAGARRPRRRAAPGAPRAHAARAERAPQRGPAPGDAHPRRGGSGAREGAASSSEPTQINARARGARHGPLAGARRPRRRAAPGAPRAHAARADRAPQRGPAPGDAHARRVGRGAREGAVSSSEPTKIDVRERGANAQASDRRLYVQLQVFTGCLEAKGLVRALESSRIEAVLYQDVNDPRGVGVLALAEDPAFFVHGLRELLNADPFAPLALKPEYAMFGRTYASGFET